MHVDADVFVELAVAEANVLLEEGLNVARVDQRAGLFELFVDGVQVVEER